MVKGAVSVGKSGSDSGTTGSKAIFPIFETSKLRYVPPKKLPPSHASRSKGLCPRWTELEDKTLESAVMRHLEHGGQTGRGQISWSQIYGQNLAVFEKRNAKSLKLHWLFLAKRRR